ncbi:MAG: hypothetical protein JWN04_6484 [Myxococcaceae bacterium]|nr:hypothetical protein [Myxococcaceae bacterium]
MALDATHFVSDLEQAVDSYDRSRAEQLCGALISQMKTTGERFAEDATARILKMLRNRRMFQVMEQVADAAITAGERGFFVRTEYVQSLIDQGNLRGADNELRALCHELPVPPAADHVAAAGKARGLLGRLYKQQYVALSGADLSRRAAVLKQALAAYSEAVAIDPDELWYQINVVALTARALRDELKLEGLADPALLAGKVLARLQRKDRFLLAEFDLATGFEACIALGDAPSALDWLRDYLHHKAATAFSVSSTYRQMLEIWQLTPERGLGAAVLPALQHAVASRNGGSLQLLPTDIRSSLTTDGELTSGATQSLEKAFGKDSSKALDWFRLMLQRARMVGQVARLTEPERGIGTGFLVRAKDFFKVPGQLFEADEWLLLTNSHVLGECDRSALPAEVACVNFEVLGLRRIRFSRLIWESSSKELDATILRMRDLALPDPLEAYEMPDTPMTYDRETHRRLCVIGHEGGGSLSVSLQDSLQVGWVPPYVHYRTPTGPGSSGSPVFDEYWRLVALHHSAREQVLSPAGDVRYDANEGIWIQAIRTKTNALD